MSDITYIWTSEGWLYLAVVLDALNLAVKRRSPGAGLIHHSDGACQYASWDYKKALEGYEMLHSMSRKGDFWDNVVAESCFGTVHKRLYRTRDEARMDIFEYIEKFYNRIRLHSALGYKSPVDFEAAAQAKAA
ncbi:integrase core domain-containing protein [bacterium]|nr:integrase core domain-containing protein [bacterium]